jgi:arginyl-tRNA synthetase
VLYVTDLSQGSHFKLVFTASQAADYVPSMTKLEHIGFGLVLGDDGKRLRSRSGETFPLRDLLELAIESAREVIEKRHKTSPPPLSANNTFTQLSHDIKWTVEKKRHVAQVMGIGAVKYADLSMNRESGYKFSLEKMLSFDGNTAPYMLYAYVRVKGIYRKVDQLRDESENPSVSQSKNEEKKTSQQIEKNEMIQILSTKEELTLSLHLIRFSEVIQDLSRNSYPHRVSEFSSSASPHSPHSSPPLATVAV